MNHIFLDLKLDIPNKSFQGICKITLTPIRHDIKELTLDAVKLGIQSVLIKNISQPFDYDGEKLIIHLVVMAVLSISVWR